jgi:hypothetical protein
MGKFLFEYFFRHTHNEVVQILRIEAYHSSIAYEKLRQDYPQGELKLIEMRPLDVQPTKNII